MATGNKYLLPYPQFLSVVLLSRSFNESRYSPLKKFQVLLESCSISTRFLVDCLAISKFTHNPHCLQVMRSIYYQQLCEVLGYDKTTVSDGIKMLRIAIKILITLSDRITENVA